MKKVLITEHIAKEGSDVLKENGIKTDEKYGLSPDELKGIIGNYDAIITRSGTRITKDILEKPGKLKVVGRAGVGLDNVDIEEASKKGIVVVNAPGGNTTAAAELTIAMVLNTLRKIPNAYYNLKYEKKWIRKKFMGMELFGKTFGIVGLGNVGSAVAKRVKAFDAKVIAYDELLKKSDIITHNMIRNKEITIMKDGVILVDCARGGIINEDDLYEALKNGKVAACAIDTFEKEPAINNQLLELDNVVVTPHIGANSTEAQTNVATMVCEQIANVLLKRPYRNAVNIPFIKEMMSDYQKIYFELSENIGSFAAQLSDGRSSEIHIVMVGKNFEEDIVPKIFDIPFNYQPYTVACIKGFLQHSLMDNISYMSAPYFAKEDDIIVSEGKAKNYENFNNLIILKVASERETKTIGATVYEDGTKKIVFIDNFKTDIVPEGLYLYIINNDKPGIIGKIGTILGNFGINIAGFHLSRQRSGFAMSFIRIDNLINDEILNLLKNIDDIMLVKLIKF